MENEIHSIIEAEKQKLLTALPKSFFLKNSGEFNRHSDNLRTGLFGRDIETLTPAEILLAAGFSQKKIDYIGENNALYVSNLLKRSL